MTTIDYPKIYRSSVLSRIFLVILASAMFCNGLWLASFAGNSPVFGYTIATALVAGSVFWIIAILKSKITLYQDRVEQTGLFNVTELRLEDIRGYRSTQIKSTTIFELVPNNPALKKIALSKTVFQDGLFSAWTKNLPSLDELDQHAVDLQIAEDASLGATPELRRAKVKSLRRTAQILGYGYLILSIIIAIYPHPLWLTLFLMTGPLIAIAMVGLSPANFTMLETDKVILLRKGNLSPLLMFSLAPLYVIFSAATEGGPRFPLHGGPLLIPSLIAGFVLTFIIWRVSRAGKNSGWLLLTILFVMMFYALGSQALINAALDNGASTNFVLRVTGKYRTTGKGAADYLTVARPDATYDGEIKIRTPDSVYRATALYGTVCAQIHPGALGLPWETVSACDSAP